MWLVLYHSLDNSGSLPQYARSVFTANSVKLYFLFAFIYFNGEGFGALEAKRLAAFDQRHNAFIQNFTELSFFLFCHCSRFQIGLRLVFFQTKNANCCTGTCYITLCTEARISNFAQLLLHFFQSSNSQHNWVILHVPALCVAYALMDPFTDNTHCQQSNGETFQRLSVGLKKRDPTKSRQILHHLISAGLSPTVYHRGCVPNRD